MYTAALTAFKHLLTVAAKFIGEEKVSQTGKIFIIILLVWSSPVYEYVTCTCRSQPVAIKCHHLIFADDPSHHGVVEPRR